MPLVIKKAKKRIIKSDPKHKAARLKRKIKMKNPAVKKKAALKRKLWVKKNKVAIKKYQKLNAK